MLEKLLKNIKLLSLTLISCLIALLLGEILVRVFLPQDKMVTWLEMHEDGYMMNQSGGIAFQEFGDRKATYRFNSNRLRGAEIEQGKTNILAIGDSFTFGLLLDETDTYLSQLQLSANEFNPDTLQFLNGGVGGAGMADWPAWLDHHGSDLDLDYLIYFLNYDDINRSLSKNLLIFDPSAEDSLIVSQRWQPRPIVSFLNQSPPYLWLQENSDLANIIIKLMWKYSYFVDLTKGFNPKKSTVTIPNLDSFSGESDYSVQLGEAILNRMEYWCNRNNCELIVITTGFLEYKSMSIYDQKFYIHFQDLMNEHPNTYFDNSDCIKKYFTVSIDELKIQGDTHPNELGAQAIANCTWEKLIVNF